MGFVAAKCTQCGANIEVDDTKEAGICKYCGTAFVTEKAINNYIINNNYNIQNANIVMPSKNIDNLKKLGFEEYKNGKYESADNYFRQVLEIDGDDYESLFVRFLYSSRSKRDSFHNSYMYEMFKKLSEYISMVDIDVNISELEKNRKIDFACDECQKIIMNDYVNGRNKCFNDNKLLSGEKRYSIATICSNTEYALFNLLDVLKKWLNKYKAITDNWNKYCMWIEVVIDFSSKKFECIDGTICGKSESGAESIYENAAKLESYAKVTNPGYVLPSNLISPLNGGKGVDVVKSGACYIATCVYGSYDCPQVWTLRRFRDYTLDKIWYGRLFIKCYYAISPTFVKWFGNTKWFRRFWKSKLDKIVTDLNNNGVKDTYYNDKYRCKGDIKL